MTGPQVLLLPGGRLGLRHGPINLIVEAHGPPSEVAGAYRQAVTRFQDVLEVLVGELTGLRRPVGKSYPQLQGSVAKRMVAAVWPHRRFFITPMAAVAGAVADEILIAMTAGRLLRRAYVNNGGDIALHLTVGERYDIGIVDNLALTQTDVVAGIRAEAGVGGIATSGWRGKSLSLGIADAVTVLAENAAAADVAATLIANAVNVDDPAIERRPAREIEDDSDLGDRLVTVAVGALPATVTEAALTAGAVCAEVMRAGGLITAAVVSLHGMRRLVAGDQMIACKDSLRTLGETA